MRNSSLIVLAAATLSVAAAAQTTVLSNAAPRATASVISGSNVGAPPLVYWGGWATDGARLFNFGGRGVNAAGTALSTYSNSLDAYDPATNTWTNLSVEGDATAPAARFRSATAYDPLMNRIVVFGGSPTPGVALDDCFAFDLTTNTWSAIPNPTPGVTGPTGRWDATMQYDPTSGLMILFGGQTANTLADRSAETWFLIGNSWAPLTPATSPSARGLQAMATRGAPYNDILLVGGQDAAGVNLKDTWRWNGAASNWEQITPINGTVPVTWASGNAMVHDTVRDVMVILGGPGTNTAPSNTGAAGGWTSEFDCVTNEWRAYGNNTTSQDADDPVWGNVQRFCVAFLNGKTYFWGGQNVPTIGDSTLAFVKEYQVATAASAVAYGAGCIGQSGSVLTFTADGAPWTGRVWTGTCTNHGPAAFAMTVWGFATTAVPLDAVLPGFGQPACVLLDTADAITGPMLPFGGTTTHALPLANDPSFAGISLHLQVAELDFGLSSLWTSNGITLTVGAL